MHSIDKKLREAQFFLDKMRDQEQRAFGDKEPFDHYLSAFLNAARGVDYRLGPEYPTTYPDWRKEWNAKHPNDDRRIKFISDDRDREVHESGSGRKVKMEEVKVGVGGLLFRSVGYSPRHGITDAPDRRQQYRGHYLNAAIRFRDGRQN
jgi:hypothetical protein